MKTKNKKITQCKCSRPFPSLTPLGIMYCSACDGVLGNEVGREFNLFLQRVCKIRKNGEKIVDVD